MTFGVKKQMSKNDTKQLSLGGMLHDVGKSKIDASLINKDGKLTDKELEEMKAHATREEKSFPG